MYAAGLCGQKEGAAGWLGLNGSSTPVSRGRASLDPSHPKRIQTENLRVALVASFLLARTRKIDDSPHNLPWPLVRQPVRIFVEHC